MKNIVCFGGGNAMPKAVIEELKKHPVAITSVTSMVDSGGSTGQLRRDFNVLPPGDIRRHLLALSDAPQWKKDLFRFRFGHEEFDGGHKGHVFANIFIAGLEHTLKDYSKVLDIVHEFLEIKKHRAMPATIEKVHVYARLENGEVVEGEDEIDVPKKHDPKLKIRDIFLKPEAKAYKPVLDSVRQADIIIIGPGDMYSSVLPCFLPKGISGAMKKTKAVKMLICPAMTKLGETKSFGVEDFAREVEKYIGTGLDFVIYNTAVPERKRMEEYKKKENLAVDMVLPKNRLDSKKFVGRKLLLPEGPIEYDSKKVVSTILDITGEHV